VRLLFFRLFFDYRTALSIFFVRPLCSKSQSITQNEITGELGAILCDCRARIFHKQNVKALNLKFKDLDREDTASKDLAREDTASKDTADVTKKRIQ